MKKILSLLIICVLTIEFFEIIPGIMQNEKGNGIIDVSAGENTAQYQNKFVPEDGKTMLFIGQDDDETAAYIESTGITPAGMMLYTNLGNLSSMASSYQGKGNNQAGRMDFQDWIIRYPNTTG